MQSVDRIPACFGSAAGINGGKFLYSGHFLDFFSLSADSGYEFHSAFWSNLSLQEG